MLSLPMIYFTLFNSFTCHFYVQLMYPFEYPPGLGRYKFCSELIRLLSSTLIKISTIAKIVNLNTIDGNGCDIYCPPCAFFGLIMTDKYNITLH